MIFMHSYCNYSNYSSKVDTYVYQFKTLLADLNNNLKNVCIYLHRILLNNLPKLLKALRVFRRSILRHTKQVLSLSNKYILCYDNFIRKKLFARSNFSVIFSFAIQDDTYSSLQF